MCRRLLYLLKCCISKPAGQRFLHHDNPAAYNAFSIANGVVIMRKTGTTVAAMLVAGCTAADQNSTAVGMPNPASAYCVEIGGTLALENREGGQVGICTLPDGERVEEWELFRRDHPTDSA